LKRAFVQFTASAGRFLFYMSQSRGRNKGDQAMTQLPPDLSPPHMYIVKGKNTETALTEYQVSDGLPGQRSYSDDYASLEEAIESCRTNGWSFEIIE
jgi:hypothetical protein